MIYSAPRDHASCAFLLLIFYKKLVFTPPDNDIEPFFNINNKQCAMYQYNIISLFTSKGEDVVCGF